MRQWSWIGEIQTHTKHIMWNFPQVNATTPRWWLINIGLVAAWCGQATSHYPSRCWRRSQSPYDVTRPQWFNTLRPSQNGRHFPDDIFKCIFFNENVLIPIKKSLKFVAKCPINNIPALAQIMAWRRWGDKPLSEPMMVSLLTHICVTRPQWVKRRICWWEIMIQLRKYQLPTCSF